MATLALTGCAAGKDFWSCPIHVPPEAEFRRLVSAVQPLDAAPDSRSDVEYCKHRGFPVRDARWDTVHVRQDDGSETWKRVSCTADPEYKAGGWDCEAWNERGVRVSLSQARPESLVNVPEEMSLEEAREQVMTGYAAFEKLTARDICNYDPFREAGFRYFREAAAQDGEWLLSKAKEPGRFELSKDDYFVQFAGSRGQTPSTQRSCWGEYEYLE